MIACLQRVAVECLEDKISVTDKMSRHAHKLDFWPPYHDRRVFCKRHSIEQCAQSA